MPCIAVVLKVMLKDAPLSSDAISQKPSQKGTGSPLEMPLGLRRATGSSDLAWLLRGVSPKPESHARERDAEEVTQGEGQQRCPKSQVEAG